ncbi:polysaccharide pyruvyl transferase family protein [Methylopila sp. 73B]|uniref:polysaccharide pyruvyl transferase family protein n=1 Tax=Methylopila sp. 73B TaxID=1120792 RepID=UPI0003AAB671|nr:polysaccharide pyruvyl transferase family protein [Methylopila sp. 73B]
MDELPGLVVRGFYGNNNCGDEALLATMIQYFSHDFRIIISANNLVYVKEKFITPKIPPYDKLKVIWSLNRGALAAPDVAGLLLGGGGLGLGFGWDQYMFAWRYGKKIIHTGVHITEEFISENSADFNNVTSTFLRAANFFSVRHQRSIVVAEKLGVHPKYVPDWAFGLNQTEGPKPKGDYIVVTIRADTNRNNPRTAVFLKSIMDYAAGEGLSVALVPFDASDQNLTRSLDIKGEMMGNLFSKPTYVKYLLGQAKAVFSLGRYHPLVFGMSNDVPTFSLDTVRPGRSDDKTCLQLVEDGLEDFHFPTNRIDEFTPAEIARLVRVYGDDGLAKPFLGHKAAVDQAAADILQVLKS